ncbi:FecR domain-containing protein [Rapidithrix thailandica]|uniref:FecR domain-containing protein n=1 Tax=Rapidithrix thailandica TaxID=413964 RepID=A0AAW9RY57_9BACT
MIRQGKISFKGWLSFYGLLFVFSHCTISPDDTWVTVKTANQEERLIVLPDSSTVWLNANSSLSYPQEWKEEVRDVKLSGEGYFTVQQSVQPFRVLNGKLKAATYQGIFDVQAREHEEVCRVVTVTGQVLLSTLAQSEEQLRLGPGLAGIFDQQTGKVYMEPNRDPNVLAWRSKRLVFSQANMRYVLNVLENYFHIQIRLQNPLLYNCTFSGTFHKPSLEEVLKVLALQFAHSAIYQDGSTYLLAGEYCK